LFGAQKNHQFTFTKPGTIFPSSRQGHLWSVIRGKVRLSPSRMPWHPGWGHQTIFIWLIRIVIDIWKLIYEYEILWNSILRLYENWRGLKKKHENSTDLQAKMNLTIYAFPATVQGPLLWLVLWDANDLFNWAFSASSPFRKWLELLDTYSYNPVSKWGNQG
jgi:hypothetical protein